MKRVRNIIVALVAVVIVVFLYAASCSSDGEQGNIIKNGGFEELGKDPAPGWSLEKKVTHKGSVMLSRTLVHSGQHSLRLQPNSNNTATDITQDPFGVGQGFKADPYRGKKLYVSGWLASDGGAVAVLSAIALMDNGGALSVRLDQGANRSGMNFHEDVLVVPDDRHVKYIILLCYVEGATGAAYFDDITLTTDIPASWYKKTDERKSAAPLTAEISVDAGQKIRDIPETIYGTNIEWLWDGNGLWNDKKKALDTELIKLTREAKVSLIRFPGGILSDFYHWKDGIGPQSKRKKTRHSPGAPKSVHRFGTDEAVEFARQTGGSLMINANIVTGTPAEAAEWVSYLNNKKGAGQETSRAVYWEIGNENYIGGDAPHAKAATMTPVKYATTFLEYAKAMKAADPSIRLGAITDENYGRTSPRSYRNWTEELLSRAGDQIDFLSVHNGYAPAIAFDKGWDTRIVYEAMLAAPVLIRESLDRLSKQIDTHAGSNAARIKLAVTEWGPYFQVTSNDRFVDHVKTLGSALYTGSVLKVFLETPRVEIANFFKLNDALFMGWTGLRGGVFVPKAPYYAFQMYTRHFGSVVISSKTVSPTYNSRSVGWAEAVSDVPYLDVIASRSADGKKLFIMAINRNFDSPIKAKIRLKDFRPAPKATAWMLNGTGVDANTGTELFKAPGITWARQAEMDRNPRFSRGGPDEVKVTSTEIGGIAEAFEYSFPPHSMTSLEISLRSGATAR